MPNPINNSNWPGPNAAGMGGTPAPGSADDGFGMHGQVFGGYGALGAKAVSGGSVLGSMPANTVVVDSTGTHVY